MSNIPSLVSYHEQVREAIARRSGEPLLNSTLDHASLIVQEALSAGDDHVHILSSRLDTSCYAKPGLIAAAKAFLAGKNHHLRILVEAQDFEWVEHPLINELRDQKGDAEHGGLWLRVVPTAWSSGYNFNFMLLDDFGFRFEADRQSPAAVASFYPKGAKQKQIENLSQIFSTLWEVSRPVELN